MDSAEQFMRALFGGVNSDARMNLWQLSTKKSRWFATSDIPNVAKFTGNQSNQYIGVSYVTKAVSEKIGEDGRISIATAAGLVGLWADIDYGNAGHKAGLERPPTQEDAIAMIGQFPLPPSITVHSGNGLQLWWLLDNVLTITNDNRESVRELTKGWNDTLKNVARSFGWDLDSTYDLARVLRLPGTLNSKDGTSVKKVEILSIDGSVRYAPQQMRELFTAAQTVSKGLTVRKAVRDDILVADDASVSSRNMQALGMLDARFTQTYARTRGDAGIKDKSQSGYDFALATLGVRAKMSDQEIVDLMVSSRRECGAETKTARYYDLTVTKAKDVIAEREGMTEDVFEELSSDRKAAIEAISTAFGIEIRNIRRYVSSPPNKYVMDTQLFGSIDLGEVGAILAQDKMRTKLADLTRYMIPRFKQERWDKMAQLMLRICEDYDAGESDREMESAWVNDYLVNRQPTDDTNDAFERHWPFTMDGNTYVFSDNVSQWLDQRGLAKMSQRQVGLMLRKIGCERVKIDIPKSVTQYVRTSVNVWEIKGVE